MERNKTKSPHALDAVTFYNALGNNTLTPEQLIATYSNFLHPNTYRPFNDINSAIFLLRDKLTTSDLSRLLTLTNQFNQKSRQETEFMTFPGEEIENTLHRILDKRELEVAGIQLRRRRK